MEDLFIINVENQNGNVDSRSFVTKKKVSDVLSYVSDLSDDSRIVAIHQFFPSGRTTQMTIEMIQGRLALVPTVRVVDVATASTYDKQSEGYFEEEEYADRIYDEDDFLPR